MADLGSIAYAGVPGTKRNTSYLNIAGTTHAPGPKRYYTGTVNGQNHFIIYPGGQSTKHYYINLGQVTTGVAVGETVSTKHYYTGTNNGQNHFQSSTFAPGTKRYYINLGEATTGTAATNGSPGTKKYKTGLLYGVALNTAFPGGEGIKHYYVGPVNGLNPLTGYPGGESTKHYFIPLDTFFARNPATNPTTSYVLPRTDTLYKAAYADQWKEIRGFVKNYLGSGIIRDVLAIDTINGTLRGRTTSAGDGSFTMKIQNYTNKVCVIALPTNVEDRNAQIFFNVLPVNPL